MKCSFCGIEIEKGTGKLFYFKTGRMMSFCSMKCEKNTLKLERKPREQRWTEQYKTFKGKQETEEKSKEAK